MKGKIIFMSDEIQDIHSDNPQTDNTKSYGGTVQSEKIENDTPSDNIFTNPNAEQIPPQFQNTYPPQPPFNPPPMSYQQYYSNIPPYSQYPNQNYNPMQNSVMPPFPPPDGKPPKKGSGLKVALLCVSAVLTIVSVALILVIIQSGISNSSIVTDENSSYAVESSYGTASTLPDAPDASADENGPQISTQETSESTTASTANSAYKKVSSSVVCITSYEAGTDYALTESGEGSGIIISSDGYIATNSHVVNDSTKTGVMITLSNNEQYLGTIIGIDKKTDLAVIKISAENLTPADFADSDKLVVGQEVYAIGNPGGSAFSNSLTTGTVSAVNRVLSSNSYVKYIQTDAAINPGNSGGALVNEYGQVIGINTAKLVATDYEGMGFAIPSNTVKEIINKLIKYGYVNDRGTIGIEGKTCSLYSSKANNVPQGMIITKISTESSLYSTQTKEGDIITAVNGTEIKTSIEFIDQLREFKPGDKVTLTIFRTKENTTGEPYSYSVNATLIAETGE